MGAADAAAVVAAVVVVTAAISYAVCGSAVVRDVTAAAATALLERKCHRPLTGRVSSITAVEGDALPYRDEILPLDSVRS